jgi:hypothetical protein
MCRNLVFFCFHGIFVCLIMVLPSLTFAQFIIQGNGYLEYSRDTDLDTVYFEDWTDIDLVYKNWRLGARYEFHLPPQPYSLDTVGQGITQRFLEYRKEQLTMTVGNFYSLFGRGLVLRSFENRMLRWDSNIDGVKFDYYHRLFDFQILGGRPRDRRGRRRDALQGGFLTLKPLRFLHGGGSLVTTDLNEQGRVYWGSFFGGLTFERGSFYAERAFTDFSGIQPEGKAIYMAGDVYFGPVTVLIEYKDYDQYELKVTTVDKSPSSEMIYNNPPAVYREHLYTLMNRHQLVQNANDEKGYLLETTFSFRENTILTLSHSLTRNHQEDLLYREYYGQIEWDPSYVLNFVGGIGQQQDREAIYLNFVASSKKAFYDLYAIKAVYEHQQVKIQFNDRQYYNQLLTLSMDKSLLLTVSLLAERTTDQISAKDLWLAGQLDLHFLENFDLTLFAGSRREGKVCIGGICVFRPPFEGVEIRLINRF